MKYSGVSHLLVFLLLVTFPLFLLFFFPFSFGVGLFFFFCSKLFQQLKNPPTPLFTNNIKALTFKSDWIYLLRGLFSKNEGRTSIFFIWVVWKCSCSIAMENIEDSNMKLNPPGVKKLRDQRKKSWKQTLCQLTGTQ